MIVVRFLKNPALSLNNEGGRIYLIMLEIVISPNLHLERSLASLSFSLTFLLCSMTAFSLVFFGNNTNITIIRIKLVIKISLDILLILLISI